MKNQPETVRECMTVRLGDICKTTSGGTPSRTNPKYYGGAIPWVKSGELRDGIVTEITESITEEALKNSSAKIFPKGTLLIALYGATVGRLGILRCDAATNQAVCAIFPPPDVDCKYLFWFLRFIRSELVEKGQGGAQPNISQGIIKDLQIPLTPLEAQKLVVAEIEKQFSRLDQAVISLKRIQANLKRYKAAVLNSAVEGKLTELWQKEHSDVEPADRLLKRILAERRANWEAEELSKMKTKGSSPKDDAWKKKYKEPAAPDTTNLPKLPERWVWATIDAIAFVTKLAGFEYTKYVKYDPDGDLSVIKAENAGKNGFKHTNFSKVLSRSVSNLTRSKLTAGDLLMVFVGAGTGNVAMVPTDREYFLGPNIGMIRIQSSLVLPAYLELFLRSSVGNALALGYMKAVAQPSLSMGTIRQISVVVPPLSIQQNIVEEIDRRISVTENLKADIEANLKRAESLRQTILRQAFSGGLA